jgi:GAF domain-containing protein
VERFNTKTEHYDRLRQSLHSLLEGEQDAVANAANAAALIYHSVPDLNWVGFYFLRGNELVLGPFVGQPACVRIPVGKGVCGASVARREAIVVGNVHQFDGHIPCDASSNAELVVPLLKNGRVVGVLDLDSPHLDRFDEEDRRGVEGLAEAWLSASDLGTLPGKAP